MPKHPLPNWLTTLPIAHRGLHDDKLPENSLGAFEAAVKAGYAIELDIHRTIDNELVVMHDPDTLRATAKSFQLREETLASLAELRLFKTNYRIAALREVLAVVAGRVPLFIEIKTGTPPAVVGPTLLSLLETYQGDYAFASFDPRIVLWFRRNATGMPCGLLSGTMDYPETQKFSALQRWILRSMITAPILRPSFLAYDVAGIPSRWLSLWRRLLHVPVIIWPITTTDEQATAQQINANIIFEQIRPNLPSH